MKKYLKVLGVGVLTLGLLVGCVGDKSSKTVVSVNSENVTYQEYLKKFAIFKLQLDMTFGEDFWENKVPSDKSSDGKEKSLLEYFKLEMLNKMIDDKIVDQEAKKEGIKVDEKQLEKIVEESNKGVEANPVLKKYYADNKIDTDFIKKITQEDLVKAELEKKFTEKHQVTQAEIDKYYQEHKGDYSNEQVKASHIIILTSNPDGTPMSKDKIDEAKKQIDEIYGKITAGQDFATLAKQYSQDGTKNTGGDLGYFGRGQMDKEFENVVYGLKIGETSKPFKTKFGYHIAKLVDRKETKTNIQEVKEFIKNELQRKKFQTYLEDLKKAAKIVKYEELIKDVDKDIKPAELKPKESTQKAPTTKEEPKKETTETKK